MIGTLAGELGVPVWTVWALLALTALQLLVMSAALIDLARRSRVRGPKWLWALVIIFFSNSFIGPILYALIGRNVSEEIDASPSRSAATAKERTKRAVDALYGNDSSR